uniref:carboxylesterase/lipase family protein n=1 Tax=uncultured Sphingomonas sp. TaxID=158754 RepID=UPI0035CC6BF8
MSKVQITLADGVIEGVVASGVRRFLSVPYAAPVTDARRFRAPQPVEPWQGVRDATIAGPCAPQSVRPAMEIETDALMGTAVASGPDYLTLNVFAPDGRPEKCPVMVFVHGGSFVAGSKDADIYDGTAFARDGVVCVVINYRLGIEGFLPADGVATNIGLRDMIAGLGWVRDTIAGFGGDPDNVTMFGESGGAWCIAALMTSPLAKGLFHRAICQSGHVYLSRDPSIVRRLVRRIAKRANVAPSRDGLLGKTPQQLLPAQEWVMKPSLWFSMRDAQGRDPSFGITRFLPVHGDDVLPVSTIQALADGAGAEIQLLIGTTSEEARLFFVPGDTIAKLKRWMVVLFIKRALPRARAALRAYGLDEKGAKPGEVLTRAMTDLMFRWMTRRTAELHKGRSHVYEFEWKSPAIEGRLGAAHAVELPFVFDTLAAASGPRGLVGENPPQALADTIHALWVRFATDGSLPWPEYDAATRHVYSLTSGSASHEPVMPAAPFLP